MQITNNSSGSGVKVNLIKGVSSEAIAKALIRINEQELNIIGYESQTKTYRDETSVLRDNTQVSANNANVSATNANNSALLSTTKANEAILSSNNALTYRNEAETFKTNAKASEINADLRATAASTSEVNAKSSELLALQYKNTTLSLKDETLLLKNETVSNAITATEQATISTSNAIIAEQQAQIATIKASESLVNANNAKASELLSAQYKADNENIKTNVQTLSNSAYDSANTASIKANEASDSAIVSTTQANISIAKASEASIYATNSNTSAVNALASENKAEEWASKEYGLEVEPGLYSAKHYAITTQNTLNTKVDTTTNQTISGVKTFTSNIVGNITGNAATATKLSTTNANWVTNGTIDNAVGMLAWKNFGNGHVIFDASNGTSPAGTAVNNTNAQFVWSPAHPTLMGWNGDTTYGVRVDSARVADAFSTTSGSAPSYACRAWANINGTGTVAIRASGNVSSITDNGIGNYTVNFTIPMPDVNYAVSASDNANDDTSVTSRHFKQIRARLSTSVQIQLLADGNSGTVDSSFVSAMVLR